jgi:flagella basal body P-ring formation protein FlgA
VARTLVVLITLALTGASEAPSVVKIGADPVVEHGQITLGDIATFEGLSEERREALGRISFGPAAAPARERVFSGSSIREQILRIDPIVSVVVPSRVRVHTAYRDVRAREIQSLVERAIQLRMPWSPETVRLSAWNVPDAARVPAHAHRTVIGFRPGEDFLGRVNATVSFDDPADESGVKGERTVSVELDVRQPIVVAARPLRRGETLEPDTVHLEERELRALPRGVITELEAVLGKRVARATTSGAPLLRYSLELERLVRRNDPVMVEAYTGGLELKLQGRALENGVLGQVIRAENPHSRRRFLIEVTGERQGRVAVPGVGAGR